MAFLIAIVCYFNLSTEGQLEHIVNMMCGFERRSWKGVLDTPLCDSILQRFVNVWYFLRFLYQ